MTTRRYLDRRGRPRLYVSPDEFDRLRRRAKRARLRLADACVLAGLPASSFRRWSAGAAAPEPEAWTRLDTTLRRAGRS